MELKELETLKELYLKVEELESQILEIKKIAIELSNTDKNFDINLSIIDSDFEEKNSAVKIWDQL